MMSQLFRGPTMAGAPARITTLYSFGLFEADAVHNTLTRNGVRVKIQVQPFRLLIVLLERAGETVTREELQHALWPEGTFVDFEGSLNVVIKKLRATIDDDSDNPRFIETVPRQGYRFIAPVSKNCSSNTTEAPSAEHGPVPAQSAPVETSVRPKSRPSYLLYAALSVAMAFAVGTTWVVWHNRRLETSARNLSSRITAPVPVRRSIAVLGMHNTSGRSDDTWVGTAFSEMLNTELAGGEVVRLVSDEDVTNLRSSSPWPQTDTLDRATTERLGRALNCDLLVLGSYASLGPSPQAQMRFDVRLQNAKSGEILAEIAETGSRQQLFQIVSKVGTKLRERLGIPTLEDTAEAGVIAASPVDPDVAKFYSLGIAKLHQFDALGAKDLLQQAVNTDPKFSMAHAMLARAWAQLGYEQKRREEVRKALSLSADLPRTDHLLIEGDYYESLGDHEKSASAYHALFELFPDNVDYGLQLASAQISAGHSSEARETLSQLRHLPSPFSDDPRIDLAEAKITVKNDDVLNLIRAAISKAFSQGKRLVYAQARRDECKTLVYGRHPEQGPAVCEDAYSIFMAAGNRVGAADSIRLLADFQGTEGHSDDAIATYQRALAILEGTGEHEKTGAILNNMAINFEGKGKLDQAEKLYRKAKWNFEQAGDPKNAVITLGNIADILYEQGRLNEASQTYEHALNILAPLEPPTQPGYLLYRLADLELTEGQVERALKHAQQAVNAYLPEHGKVGYLTGAMTVLGNVLESENNLDAARQEFEQGLSLQKQGGEPTRVPETEENLAQLALEEGHPEKAEQVLRDVITQFQNENAKPDESYAYTLLSRALTEQRKLEDAYKAAQLANELSRITNDPALTLPAEIQSARLAMETANRRNSDGVARQKLLSAISRAHKLSYYRIECEGRIALGELEMKTNPTEGRNQLSSVSKQSRERGLELLANEAERAIAVGANTVAVNKSSR